MHKYCQVNLKVAKNAGYSLGRAHSTFAYVTLHEETKHNVLNIIIIIQAEIVAYGDNYRFCMEESFLCICKICFVTFRASYA